MHGKPDSYREFFLKKWADCVISNENWSILQAKFINAQIKNIKSETSERLKRKEEISWMLLSEDDKKLRPEFIQKMEKIRKEPTVKVH